MHRPSLPPKKYSWYSFLFEVDSNPGSYYRRKDYLSSQECTTGFYPTPTYLPLTPCFVPSFSRAFSKWFLSFRFTDQNFVWISLPSLTRYRLQLNHIPNLIALIIFGEYYSRCNLALYSSHRRQILIN